MQAYNSVAPRYIKVLNDKRLKQYKTNSNRIRSYTKVSNDKRLKPMLHNPA